MPAPDKQSVPKGTPPVEPWEVEYMHQEMPTHTRDEIERAATDCKKEQPKSKTRQNVLKCVRRKFS